MLARLAMLRGIHLMVGAQRVSGHRCGIERLVRLGLSIGWWLRYALTLLLCRLNCGNT